MPVLLILYIHANIKLTMANSLLNNDLATLLDFYFFAMLYE
jgi:hypothetical protein